MSVLPKRKTPINYDPRWSDLGVVPGLYGGRPCDPGWRREGDSAVEARGSPAPVVGGDRDAEVGPEIRPAVVWAFVVMAAGILGALGIALFSLSMVWSWL